MHRCMCADWLIDNNSTYILSSLYLDSWGVWLPQVQRCLDANRYLHSSSVLGVRISLVKPVKIMNYDTSPHRCVICQWTSAIEDDEVIWNPNHTTYDNYIAAMLTKVVEARHIDMSMPTEELQPSSQLLPNIAGVPWPPKQDIISKHQTRFSLQWHIALNSHTLRVRHTQFTRMSRTHA